MLRDKLIVSFFGLSVICLFIAVLIGGAGLPTESGGPLIIRFDKLGQQVDLMGGLGTFLGLGGVVAAMVLINFFLAWVIYSRERFLSYIFAAATLVIALLFLLATYNISAIN